MNQATAVATYALEAVDALTASVPKTEVTADAGEVTLTHARPQIGDIARAAGVRHQRTALTDHGERLALVVHPEDWESIVDALAVARRALARISGTGGDPISADQARRKIFGEEARRPDRAVDRGMASYAGRR